MRALLIPTDDAPRLVEHDGGLTSAQRGVGGYIEVLPDDRRLTIAAYANEEGIALRLPLNTHTCLLADLGIKHPVVGPVLVVGADDSGEDLPLPAAVDPILTDHGIV
jgi:hypothetical protein